MPETSEKSFETVIETHLLAHGYAAENSRSDPERAIVAHIGAETGKLEALAAAVTGQVKLPA